MANPGHHGKNTKPWHKCRDLDSKVYQHTTILLNTEDVFLGKFMEERSIKYNHYLNPQKFLVSTISCVKFQIFNRHVNGNCPVMERSQNKFPFHWLYSMHVSVDLHHIPPYSLLQIKQRWFNEWFLVWKLFHIYYHTSTFPPFLLFLSNIRSPKQHKVFKMRVAWFYMLCSLFPFYIHNILFAFVNAAEQSGDVLMELYIIIPKSTL